MVSRRIQSPVFLQDEEMFERAVRIADVLDLPSPPTEKARLAAWLIERQQAAQHAQLPWFKLSADEMAQLLKSGQFRRVAPRYSMS